MRMVFGVLLAALMAWPLTAQESDQPWAETVTGQIEAMRAGEAGTALDLAGAAFRVTYKDAEQFLADVERAGYGPIVAARSFSLGAFRRIDAETAIQVVSLVGPDQSLYEALYQLRDEPGLGWRVQGVVMRKAEGLGI